MRQDYRDAMEAHPLRREIVVTQIVNDLVNGAGITFFHRLSAGDRRVGRRAGPGQLRGPRDLRSPGADRRRSTPATTRSTPAVQTRMRIEVRTLVERASRWLVNNRRPPLDSEATVDYFGVVSRAVVRGAARPAGRAARREAFDAAPRRAGGEGRARRSSPAGSRCCPRRTRCSGIVETATRDGVDPLEVARVHFALGERLGLPTLVARILALPRDDRWQTMARAALRDDLHAVHAQLTAQVLAAHRPADGRRRSGSPTGRTTDEAWSSRAVETLEEICADDDADLARLSVGLRVVRTLLVTPVTVPHTRADRGPRHRRSIVLRPAQVATATCAAVDGVTFTVARGEFFGILGPNGAGKTTTLEIIEGLRAARLRRGPAAR